jgi:ankyrin repeat protein
VLHLAATNGNCVLLSRLHLTHGLIMPTDETLDILLDQEGLEIDEPSRMEGDTPLHSAIRYTNALDKSDWEHGQQIVDILIDAGCDPRIRNSAKLKPVDLADPRNEVLRQSLRKAEFAMVAGDDVVQDDDDGPTGSGSESD